MRLTEPNHALQLTRRGCDPLFLGTRVHAEFTHLDVGLNERIGGCFGEDGMHAGAGVRNVRSERLDGLYISTLFTPLQNCNRLGLISSMGKVNAWGTYDNISPGSLWPILQIKPHQMLGQPPVVQLVHLVQDEIQQVKSRNQRRREVNVGRDGQFGVVSRVDGIGSCEDGSTGVEGGDDARFGNRDGLLFLLVSIVVFTM